MWSSTAATMLIPVQVRKLYNSVKCKRKFINSQSGCLHLKSKLHAKCQISWSQLKQLSRYFNHNDSLWLQLVHVSVKRAEHLSNRHRIQSVLFMQMVSIMTKLFSMSFWTGKIFNPIQYGKQRVVWTRHMPP